MKAIIFDFGNVIGYFDHRLATKRLHEQSAVPLDVLQAAMFDPDLEDEYESGRLTTGEFLKRVRSCAGKLGCTDEIIASCYADMFWPNTDVCALVPKLKPHYRLLLGSNTTELHSKRFRSQFADTLAHFDALVLSYEIGFRKPRAGFFEHCQRLAGCAPHECLFIDDMPVNVEGARACGWQAIVYTDFLDLQTRLARLGVYNSGE